MTPLQILFPQVALPVAPGLSMLLSGDTAADGAFAELAALNEADPVPPTEGETPPDVANLTVDAGALMLPVPPRGAGSRVDAFAFALPAAAEARPAGTAPAPEVIPVDTPPIPRMPLSIPERALVGISRYETFAGAVIADPAIPAPDTVAAASAVGAPVTTEPPAAPSVASAEVSSAGLATAVIGPHPPERDHRAGPVRAGAKTVFPAVAYAPTDLARGSVAAVPPPETAREAAGDGAAPPTPALMDASANGKVAGLAIPELPGAMPVVMSGVEAVVGFPPAIAGPVAVASPPLVVRPPPAAPATAPPDMLVPVATASAGTAVSKPLPAFPAGAVPAPDGLPSVVSAAPAVSTTAPAMRAATAVSATSAPETQTFAPPAAKAELWERLPTASGAEWRIRNVDAAPPNRGTDAPPTSAPALRGVEAHVHAPTAAAPAGRGVAVPAGFSNDMRVAPTAEVLPVAPTKEGNRPVAVLPVAALPVAVLPVGAAAIAPEKPARPQPQSPETPPEIAASAAKASTDPVPVAAASESETAVGMPADPIDSVPFSGGTATGADAVLAGAAPLTKAVTPAIQPPGDPAPVLAQVTGAALAAGEGVTELRLSPEELGNLRIDLKTDGDRVSISLSAERQDTLDLMRRHADRLVDDLRSLGFARLDLSFGRWSGQGGQDSASQAAPPAAGETAVPDDRPATVAPLPVPVGGLYLRI